MFIYPCNPAPTRFLKQCIEATRQRNISILFATSDMRAEVSPLPPTSSWDFQAKQKRITNRREIWLKKSILIMRLFFAIRRGAIRWLRGCQVKSTSTSKKSAIRICSGWLTNQRDALVNVWWDALLRFFAKARARLIQHG